MSGIRPCELKDLDQVTELFRQTFRNPGFDLTDYFRRIYFENPWASDRFPSLVTEQNGRIKGFLGVIPRRMRFRGRRINVAVGSALMVAADQSGNRNPLTGVSLMRQFLEGEQDLSLTDTANDLTRGIWTSLEGAIAYPYSYTWIRPLQPMQTFLDIAFGSSAIHRVAKPGAFLLDLVAKKMPLIDPRKPACHVENIDTSELEELMKSHPVRALMPDYDSTSLEWVIERAEENATHGPLAKRIVETVDGKLLGWYVYHQNRNGVGRVLQLVAQPRAMEIVLDSLIFEAHENGLAALRGRTEPDHTYLFNKRYCLFQGRPWFLVHSCFREIVNAFQTADVFFSGLDGEQWLRTIDL